VLTWAKPYLAPLYAWAARVPEGTALRLPEVVTYTLLFLQEQLSNFEANSPFVNQEQTSQLANNYLQPVLAESQRLFEAMANDPQKSQFIETENYMRGEIARWFRMPLSKLQDLSDTNNSALEQVNINYVTDCLMPWIVRFEQEADQKLYAIYERDVYDGYIDTDMLLRGDSAAMERKVRTMFTSGAITPNEVRKMYAINTIDEDYANSSYMPSNMMPGETAIPFWTAQADKNNQLTNSSITINGTAVSLGDSTTISGAPASFYVIQQQSFGGF
jgi:hypothetical protein